MPRVLLHKFACQRCLTGIITRKRQFSALLMLRTLFKPRFKTPRTTINGFMFFFFLCVTCCRLLFIKSISILCVRTCTYGRAYMCALPRGDLPLTNFRMRSSTHRPTVSEQTGCHTIRTPQPWPPGTWKHEQRSVTHSQWQLRSWCSSQSHFCSMNYSMVEDCWVLSSLWSPREKRHLSPRFQRLKVKEKQNSTAE